MAGHTRRPTGFEKRAKQPVGAPPFRSKPRSGPIFSRGGRDRRQRAGGRACHGPPPQASYFSIHDARMVLTVCRYEGHIRVPCVTGRRGMYVNRKGGTRDAQAWCGCREVSMSWSRGLPSEMSYCSSGCILTFECHSSRVTSTCVAFCSSASFLYSSTLTFTVVTSSTKRRFD